ncbi:MAG TPA: polysaccharide pyruvyl transferase CsaB [Firmicutes bacterium]|nr:polysaccharide pyruvyl transferase CsaB [Bacillota bacterium]
MILVSGYYGYHNSGDEAILAALCQDLNGLGVHSKEITVLSGNPAHTQKTYNVTAISRLNPFAVVDAIGHGRLLISGGGSLLQDATSWRTIPYYLSIIQMALAFGLKVVVYGQGIGPVKNRLYQRWIVNAFSRAAGVAVRDPGSAELLQDWGMDSHLLSIAADPVFGLELESEHSPESSGQTPGITINLRPYRHWDRDFPHWIQLIKGWLSAFELPVRFVALGPGDLQIGVALQRAIPQLSVIDAGHWRSALRLMGQNEICVSMRLHGVIFAALGGSLPIGIGYDPKIEVLGLQLGIPVYPAAPDIRLTNAIAGLLTDRASQLQQLSHSVAELRQRSEQNRRVLATVI